MPEYARVRDPISGHEYNVTPAQLAVTNLAKKDVIDKPTESPSGDPAPVLYRTPLGTPRPGTKVARSRAKSTAAKKAAGTQDGPESAAPIKED